MKAHTKSESGSISEAKLAANRRNAQFSTGPSPTGRQRTRFNALNHGLAAQVAWTGRDPQLEEEFCARARERLAPRNAREDICVDRLLKTRLRDQWLLGTEKAIFTRRPLLQSAGDDVFSFLQDAGALNALTLLTRHLAHLDRVFGKDLGELLELRTEADGIRRKGTRNKGVKAPVAGRAKPAATGVAELEHRPGTVPAPAPQFGIEAFLANCRSVLPGEDASAFDDSARAFWPEYEPANQLEEFIVGDLVSTEWRLDRATDLQALCLQQSAISASGHDGGLGLGFLHDCQQHQALEALRNYEGGLRRRLTRLKSLWRKLRKQGWQDAATPATQPATELPAPTNLEPAVATAESPSASPRASDSCVMPDAAPPAVILPSSDPDKASPSPPAPVTKLNPTHSE